MAYVAPNSKLLLLRGTGLTPDYTHTYRFKSESEQYNFFYSKKYAEFDDLSYQRITKNELKVNRFAQNLYSCDYLMFQNSRGTGGLSDKWYYGFITDIEYINEKTTKITYEIDMLQTWFKRLFDGLQPCFIVREHSALDGLYSNTQPENLDLGSEYQYESQKWDNLARKPRFVAGENSAGGTGTYGGWLPCVSFPADLGGNLGKDDSMLPSVSGVPSAVRTYAFKYFQTSGPTIYRGFYNFLKGIPDNRQPEIVDMFMYPEDLIDNPVSGTQKNITETVLKAGKKGANPWKDYFTPKNNKLYTYPYCYILVTNGCGQSMELYNEYFARDEDNAIFDINGTFAPNPEFTCMARNYNEIQGNAGMNSLSLSGVPKISWITDSYKVYMAQNGSSVRTNNVLTAINAVRGVHGMVQNQAASLVTAAATQDASQLKIADDSAAFSGISGMAMNLAKMQDLRKMNDNVHSASAPSAMYLNGEFGFRAFMARIPLEYARRIDDFFTCFGYATNQVRKPDIFTRKSFNYLQANNVVVISNVPMPAKKVFASILSKGITFWDKSVKIGNYNANNQV